MKTPLGFKSSFAFKAAKNNHDQEMKIVDFFLVHGMGERDGGGGGVEDERQKKIFFVVFLDDKFRFL